MSEYKDHWIIKIGGWYLQHLSGEFTKNVTEAHGFRYKRDAAKEMKYWQSCVGIDPVPYTYPSEVWNSCESIYLLRRKDASAIKADCGGYSVVLVGSLATKYKELTK